MICCWSHRIRNVGERLMLIAFLISNVSLIFWSFNLDSYCNFQTYLRKLLWFPRSKGPKRIQRDHRHHPVSKNISYMESPNNLFCRSDHFRVMREHKGTTPFLKFDSKSDFNWGFSCKLIPVLSKQILPTADFD